MSVPFTSSEVNCPECRRPMVELVKYQRVIDGDSVVGDDNPVPMPWDRSGQVFFLFGIIDFIMGSIEMAVHKAKAKKIFARELPAYPNSLVCTQCLFVLRRK